MILKIDINVLLQEVVPLAYRFSIFKGKSLNHPDTFVKLPLNGELNRLSSFGDLNEYTRV